MAAPVTEVPIQVCDSCNEAWWGATVADTVAAKWKRVNIYRRKGEYASRYGGIFVMCPACVERYQPAWDRLEAERKQAA